MERYFGKGHSLYIDNPYTSLRLANYLVENGMNVTGTGKAENNSNLN